MRSVVHGNPEVAGDGATLPDALPLSCSVGEVVVAVVVVDIVVVRFQECERE